MCKSWFVGLEIGDKRVRRGQCRSRKTSSSAFRRRLEKNDIVADARSRKTNAGSQKRMRGKKREAYLEFLAVCTGSWSDKAEMFCEKFGVNQVKAGALN